MPIYNQPLYPGSTPVYNGSNGAVLYVNNNKLQALPIGTDGQALVLAGGLPSWGSAGGLPKAFFGPYTNDIVAITATVNTLIVCQNWHVPAGVTVFLNNVYVLAKEEILIDAGGVVHCDGASAASFAVVSNQTANYYGAGKTNGSNGGAGAGAAGANGGAYGGIGGNGGNVGATPGGIGGAIVSGGTIAGDPAQFFALLTGRTVNVLGQFGGGASGGNGAGDGFFRGGSNGEGAGILGLYAKKITNNGTLRAKGGRGGNGEGGNGAGGGGGGGGTILGFCNSFTGNAPDVSGGAFGNGSGTGANGTNGSAGNNWLFAGTV